MGSDCSIKCGSGVRITPSLLFVSLMIQGIEVHLGYADVAKSGGPGIIPMMPGRTPSPISRLLSQVIARRHGNFPERDFWGVKRGDSLF